MPVSTVAVCTFLGVIALAQHIYNMPETSAKAAKQAEKQMRYDEKSRQLDIEIEAARQAKLNPTPTPEETLIPNTWTPMPYPKFIKIEASHN
jgi:hypothetical protein